jgi:polyhydroxyalkanoate synthase
MLRSQAGPPDRQATTIIPLRKRAPAAPVFVPPPPACPTDRDSYASTALGDVVDRSVHAALARFTLGLSPAALAESYFNWATHLAASPGKQMQLIQKAARKVARLTRHAGECACGRAPEPCIEPLPQDRRFVGEAWQQWPYKLIYQSFLLQQQWWHNATTSVRGVTKQHEDAVEFATRQILDVFAPSNFLLTNPELQRHALEHGGMNFVQGAQNFLEDWERTVSGKRPAGCEALKVGRDVAITPAKSSFAIV